MSLVEEYYELNEAEEVSVAWKVLQIFFYGCAAVFGLWCGFMLAYLRMKFEDRCFLFTDVESSVKDNKIDQSNINWESDSWCDYYQFSMVSSFIVGIIWGTLFLMCGKGGKSLTGLPQPWRIVWPSLLFNFIYFIISLITGINIQQGTDYFCARNGINKKKNTKSLVENCAPIKLLLKKDLYATALQIEMVVQTSWACAFSWFLLFLFSFLRILFVIDFHLYKICVFKIDETVQNRKEEVLRITNYEEPKKLYSLKAEDSNISEITQEDLRADTRKKKMDKKVSKHSNTADQSPHITNAVFYQTADIRMLSRDKKRKNSLDLAFAKGRHRMGFGLQKPIQSNSNGSGNSDKTTLSYEYSTEDNEDEDEDEDEDDANWSYAIQKPEDLSESGSGSEILNDFDSNSLLRFKKRI